MKNWLYHLGLAAIAVFCLLSIFGAFLGAENARSFFNSVPLAAWWVGFTILLVMSIAAFRALHKQSMLFLMHAGCVLILLGGLWGSRAVQTMTASILGKAWIEPCYLKLYPGRQSSTAYRAIDGQPLDLGFSVALNDFQIHYYDNPANALLIQSDLGQWQIPPVKGAEYLLSEQAGKVRVLDTFTNLKIRMENGKPVASEGPAVESNPAWLLEFVSPDGQVTQQFVFEKFSGHAMPGYQFLVTIEKRGMVRDYISDVQVFRDGQPVAAKQIEVNYPLHYAGFHIYQDSYGQDEMGQYSVLQVVPDQGVRLVFGGYMLIMIGLTIHFTRRIWMHRRSDRCK
ncbi:MAG: cytochrome c biogenesis protein ResB [Sedimentisphaerales bacterium]|nr:cytochrome c biogenesis protein ResB [Sedimentisphaerales bacterium]